MQAGAPIQRQFAALEPPAVCLSATIGATEERQASAIVMNVGRRQRGWAAVKGGLTRKDDLCICNFLCHSKRISR